jgi:hypothetical protein
MAQIPWDFSSLKALFINCTLKRSPEISHTQGLADLSIGILRHLGFVIPPQADSCWLGEAGPGRAISTRAPAALPTSSPTGTPRS